MNIYLMKPQFKPDFGLFAAKKKCNMPLNAVRFGAKCSAFWCKTQGKMVLNAVQNGAKCKMKSIIMHCNCIIITFIIH